MSHPRGDGIGRGITGGRRSLAGWGLSRPKAPIESGIAVADRVVYFGSTDSNLYAVRA
jgi:hypothetical protein